jgi:hypothetical protein
VLHFLVNPLAARFFEESLILLVIPHSNLHFIHIFLQDLLPSEATISAPSQSSSQFLIHNSLLLCVYWVSKLILSHWVFCHFRTVAIDRTRSIGNSSMDSSGLKCTSNEPCRSAANRSSAPSGKQFTSSCAHVWCYFPNRSSSSIYLGHAKSSGSDTLIPYSKL